MAKFKEVSDLDQSADGTMFGIEWEYFDGGRHWEWFATEEERAEVLKANEAETEVPDEPSDGFNSDFEADADVLRMAGFGTDEDYGGCDERY